ncbi:MAG: rhomboid family intramembrane serine protease [Opitutae bacterium]|nr:rhomboid family intramembrane serine protease [Opitutae bacterium]
MRSLGKLDQEEKASLFVRYLNGCSIRAQLEEEAPGGPWTIWVHDEEKLDHARKEMSLYLKNQSDPKYQQIAHQGDLQQKLDAKKEFKLRKNEERLRRSWTRSTGRVGTTTLSLISISVIIHLLPSLKSFFLLYFSKVLQGELWRLVTPIFVHFGLLHVLFNMLWLFDLGGMIERRRGSLFLFLFVVIVAVSSNFCQYLLSGPNFGGMSGVVYALFGYIWMKGKFDPADGLALHPNTIVLMLVFFALGFSGLMPIANGCHSVGLLVGTLWGFLSAKRKLRR